MKKTITLSVFGFLMILSTLSTFAQKGTQHFTGAAATTFYKGASQVFVNEKRNTISFIRLKEDQQVSEKNAKDWLQHDVLKLSPDGNLIQYQQFNDKVGYSHIRYREYYKGVPVEYGVYYVHSKGGTVKSANGEWYNGISLSTKPSITSNQAYLVVLLLARVITRLGAVRQIDTGIIVCRFKELNLRMVKEFR